MPFSREQIDKACGGKFRSGGGLNKDDLIQIVGRSVDTQNMTRAQLLAIICNKEKLTSGETVASKAAAEMEELLRREELTSRETVSTEAATEMAELLQRQREEREELTSRETVSTEEATEMEELLQRQREEREELTSRETVSTEAATEMAELIRKQREEREKLSLNQGMVVKKHRCEPSPAFPNIDSEATQRYFDSNPIPGTRDFDSHRFDLPLILVGEGMTIFVHIQTLSRGSYGYVCLYQTRDQRYEIAVKQGKVSVDVDVLVTVRGRCSIVEGHGFRIDGRNSILVMEVMEGDLRYFRDRYVSRTATEIGNRIGLEGLYKIFVVLYNVLSAFNCLHRLGLYYTDTKLENFLYTCTRGALRLYLGDLGSAVPKTVKPSGGGFAVATYPSHFRHVIFEFVPQVYDVIYGILVLFYLLTRGDWRLIYWDVPAINRRENISRHLNSIRFGPEIQTYYELFVDMLDVRQSMSDSPRLFEMMERTLSSIIDGLSRRIGPGETFIKPLGIGRR